MDKDNWNISADSQYSFSQEKSDTLDEGVKNPDDCLAVYTNEKGGTLRYNYNQLCGLARVSGDPDQHLSNIGLTDESIDQGIAYLQGRGAGENDDLDALIEQANAGIHND